VTDILRMDEAHRTRAEFDRGTARPADRSGTGQTTTSDESRLALGDGVLTAQVIRAIAAIEVPAKEEVAKSVAYVSERISGTAGAGLAAQANVVPPRALALLTDHR
jgi:hypothetical protein